MHGELKDTPCEEEDSHEFLYLDIKDEIVFAPKAHSKFSGKQYLRLKLKQVFTLRSSDHNCMDYYACSSAIWLNDFSVSFVCEFMGNLMATEKQCRRQ